MKVYSADIPVPDYDYSANNWDIRDKEYYEDLKRNLHAKGYTGSLTGELVWFHIADGHAVYMICCGPNNTKMCLIHCETGDSYSLPIVQLRGYTKKDIIRLVERNKNMEPIFGEK